MTTKAKYGHFDLGALNCAICPSVKATKSELLLCSQSLWVITKCNLDDQKLCSDENFNRHKFTVLFSFFRHTVNEWHPWVAQTRLVFEYFLDGFWNRRKSDNSTSEYQ